MTDRPVIFSAPMVRALLDGRKTMTRRLAWRPERDRNPCVPKEWSRPTTWQRVQPGDRLWVRETWKPHSMYADMLPREVPHSRVFYAADDAYAPSDTKWVPPIHMPRWASRLTLIVTATKIERLQEISEEDARAEGVEPLHDGFFPYGIATFMTTWVGNREVPAQYCPTAKLSFKMLWEYLHGPESWDANPEVVALTFRVVRANIDSAEACAA